METRDDQCLPTGVLRRPLTEHADSRGRLMEVFRKDATLPDMRQFNVVRSEGDVLRGVHVHPTHADYIMVLQGTLVLGVHDLRDERPDGPRSAIITLRGERPEACFVPVGVAHGFYFPEPTLYLYGLSAPWHPDGDFGCRWDDPDLALDWPVNGQPTLSDRDENAGTLAEMVERFQVAIRAEPTA